jgi:hypothetical protein
MQGVLNTLLTIQPKDTPPHSGLCRVASQSLCLTEQKPPMTSRKSSPLAVNAPSLSPLELSRVLKRPSPHYHSRNLSPSCKTSAATMLVIRYLAMQSVRRLMVSRSQSFAQESSKSRLCVPCPIQQALNLRDLICQMQVLESC